MKYVALLSGGKDSCFNLLHCFRNGHQLVAAASLGPGAGREELDSYLYQTVGQDAIELVAQALDVPLYRKVITGSAIEQGFEYGSRHAGRVVVEGDETEDLYELLRGVKERHTDIQGVSVGAILSSYQRIRVENVCSRLSLTPLCYLWQRDQGELLGEMISQGFEAILIKVAGIGLTPEHLGRTLAEMEPTLRRLNKLYGSHICGEGGEYETLTLDSPMFKKRLILKDVEPVIHSDSAFATVAYLRIKEALLVEKETSPIPLLSHPPLSGEFDDLRRRISGLKNKQLELSTTAPISSTLEDHSNLPTIFRKFGRWVFMSNIQKDTEKSALSTAMEVSMCLERLRDILKKFSLSLANLVFVNIFLKDMGTFPEVNTAYKSFFGISPPSRACVAVDLPSDISVRLDCVAFIEQDAFERRSLHVQGLSYWAPANIGPYSQAIVVQEQLFVSGQIGLLPSSLALPVPSDLAFETALAFQHVHRILQSVRETHGAEWPEKVVLHCQLCWLVDMRNIPLLRAASEALDAYVLVPMLIVGARALPRGAQVELQVMAHTGKYTASEDGETEARHCRTPSFKSSTIENGNCSIYLETFQFAEVKSSSHIIALASGDMNAAMEDEEAYASVRHICQHAQAVRIFHKGPFAHSVLSFTTRIFGDDLPAITTLSVPFIATRSGEDWNIALLLMQP